MNKVLKLFITDIKTIATNIPTLIIISGLIVLPSMYSLFNIASLIDPYSNASNLPIAVYNYDQDVKIDGEIVNVGNELIENLQNNDDLDWQFPNSEDELIKRLNTGEYYAGLIIPGDFTMSLKNAIDTYEGPSIKYVVNEKVNAISPKMTEAGAEGISLTINQEINRHVIAALVDYSNDLNDEIDTNNHKYYELLDKVENFINDFAIIDQKLDNYLNIASRVEIDYELYSQKVDQYTSEINNIDYSKAYQMLDEISPHIAKANDVKDQIEELESVTSNLHFDIDTSNYVKVNSDIELFIFDTWPKLKAQIIDIDQGLREIKEDYLSVEEYLIKDSNKASEFMAEPVTIKTEKIYPVKNYGTASTPFYGTLCLWVGALLLVSLLSVNTKGDSNLYQKYCSKLMLFLLIAIMQALVASILCLELLDINVVHSLYFIGFSVFISIIFTTIVYSIVYVLGNVGKAICIIILVLSIAGGGGNFPIEVSPQFFNQIYPYLPFTYGVKLLREAVAGVYYETVVSCFKILSSMALIVVVFSIISIAKIKPYFDKFDKLSKKNNIIH